MIMYKRLLKRSFVLIFFMSLSIGPLDAGQAPGSIASYWGSAEMIAIGSVSDPFEAVHGNFAKYHLQIDEIILGPNLERPVVKRLSYHTSNDRWNTGRTGTTALFFGIWDEKEKLWNVHFAIRMDEAVDEAIRFKIKLKNAESKEAQNRLLEKGFQSQNPHLMGFLPSEAHRLNRQDLLLQKYQSQFYRDQPNVHVIGRLFRMGDENIFPAIVEMLENQKTAPSLEPHEMVLIVRELSRHRKKDATKIIRPYLNSDNEILALAVADHLMNVEEEGEHWRFIFNLAQKTTDNTVRHNACYTLQEAGRHIPLADLIEIRDFVKKHEVSYAIQIRLDRRIRQREVETASEN